MYTRSPWTVLGRWLGCCGSMTPLHFETADTACLASSTRGWWCARQSRERLPSSDRRSSFRARAGKPWSASGAAAGRTYALAQDVVGDGTDALRVKENVLRLNLVLSRTSYPIPNRVSCQVSGPSCLVDVQLRQGRYDPLTVSQTENTWVTVARVECSAGDSVTDVPLPVGRGRRSVTEV